METKYILNLWCKAGLCVSCIGKSAGSKSDPVSYVCTCNCHAPVPQWQRERS